MSERKYSRETLEKRKAKRLSKTTETSFEEALQVISNDNIPLDELREEYKQYLSNKKLLKKSELEEEEPVQKKSKPSRKPRRKAPVVTEEQSDDDSGGVSMLLNNELGEEEYQQPVQQVQQVQQPVQQPYSYKEPEPNNKSSIYDNPRLSKNPAPSSQKIKAEEWSLLSQLEPDIMKLALQILYEETIKFESGSSSYTSIDYSICLAMDRIKSVRKDLEKQKEVDLEKQKEVSKQEEIQEKGYDSETETEDEKKIRYRKERLKWIEKMQKNKDQQIQVPQEDNSTTISVPK
jgi:hypothetical protein